jgi:hypothetical protein
MREDLDQAHAGPVADRQADPSAGARLVAGQIELYFSIVQRKALTPNDLGTLLALVDRLLDFGEHYRQIARPFEWTFTRQEHNDLIARIDRHEPELALAA